MSTYRLKGTAGAVINQSFPLNGEMRIGTEDDCDIRVEPEEGADGLLATVAVREDGAVRLVVESGAGVTVNGEVVMELDLAGGDELRLGRSRLIFQAPGLRPERVLTEEAIAPRRRTWPWWLAAALLAGAAAGAAWWQGWITWP